jgi:DNA-binding MarR family transcriptional regulator
MKPSSPPPARPAALHHDRSEFNVVFVHSALDDLGLSPAQFRVYCHLARRANAGAGGEGAAWPSVAEIARVCRLHPDTARAALRWLSDHRLLVRERRRGDTTVYRLTPASRWLCPPPSESDTSPPDSGDSPPSVSEGTPPKRRETKDIQEGNPQKEHTHAADSFAPPSLEEVLQTADLRAIPRDCAEKFFHDQTANEWRNRDGHPLRQWPAKLQGYAVSWRAVDHQRAAVTAVRSSAPPKRRGAFAAVAPAEAFTNTRI